MVLDVNIPLAQWTIGTIGLAAAAGAAHGLIHYIQYDDEGRRREATPEELVAAGKGALFIFLFTTGISFLIRGVDYALNDLRWPPIVVGVVALILVIGPMTYGLVLYNRRRASFLRSVGVDPNNPAQVDAYSFSRLENEDEQIALTQRTS